MIEQIYSENIRKIMQNRESLEKKLKIKLSSKERVLFLDGKAEDTFLALSVIEAINLGFHVHDALFIAEEGFAFEKINIKDFSNRKNLEQVRGRIIGEKRKALNTVEDLTDCLIAVHTNQVGIIGRIECIEKAIYAIRKIIAGSKHSSIYAYLEEQKAQERKGFL